MKIILTIIAVAALLSMISGCQQRDDSDPPDGNSGMIVLTDSLTECQYLSVGHDLTPRLGIDGNQICGKKP